MKIKTVRIENFRSFLDETIHLNRYSCFVGPNGAGKSNVLSALNFFFQERSESSTDLGKIIDEDYFGKITSNPIRITVTFDNLSEAARTALSNYVRQNELVVTAEAIFDPSTNLGRIRHFGHRSGIVRFAQFFSAMKDGAPAPQLNAIYDALRQDFTELTPQTSKDKKAAALQAYEAEHAERCEQIASNDNFYGINSTGILQPFIQWVYVPAVKDAGEEEQEGKNTALGKLVARAVSSRTTFEAEINELKAQTLVRYQEILTSNQASLAAISHSLRQRLESWSHPNVRLDMEWLSDPSRSVELQKPIAGIKTGEGDFLGSLARMGHGLQRSYLLALLQELSGSDIPNAATLILACEEPELYQHPPQARYLAGVFGQLSEGNNQIIVTTHSPLFVSGEGFENVRLARRVSNPNRTVVRSLTFQNLTSRIRSAMQESQQRRITGLIAKIHQSLQPGISEMFFAKVPILVEGLEDVAYITAQLHILDLWTEFRRLGCHLVPANGKGKLIQPLAITRELEMPVFVVFDADGNVTNASQRSKHEIDNNALMRLIGLTPSPFPATHVWGNNHIIWQNDITDAVRVDFGTDYSRITDLVRVHYAQETGLEKNELFIADWLAAAHAENKRSPNLTHLCESILTFARSV